MSATLAQLRTRIRQRTDLVNSDFVTDTELTGLINTSYKELYGLLVRNSLHRAEDTESYTADGSASYTLPDDFLGLIGVYRNEGDYTYPLERFPDKFRPGTLTGVACMYRVSGFELVLYPIPTSGTYELVYIPVPGELAADSDTLDGVLGWEEFVVIDVSIMVLEKEESDTSKLEYKRERILRRIQDEAQLAELTETPRILNIRDQWRSNDPADYFVYRNGDDWDQ